MSKRVKDISGQRFGKLVVSSTFEIRKSGKNSIVFWLVKCDCGTEKFMARTSIERAIGCGCEKKLPPQPKALEKFVAVQNRLFRNARSGAKTRNIKFELSLNEFKNLISKACFYCGKKDTMSDWCYASKSEFFHNGIDRRDNEIGYTVHNCVPCCKICNVSKNSYTEKQFLEHVRAIANHRNLGSMKSAIVTGVFGQDGSYLTEILLSNGFKVIGVNRRGSDRNAWRIQHFANNPNFIMEYADILDASRMYRLVRDYLPTHFFHLAANSFVGDSWNLPISTLQCNAIGSVNCLEAVRLAKDDCKFYNAASSEMFGKVLETPQSETTKFNVISPYAAAKELAFNMTRIYRDSYGMFTCNGILFNHESPRRSIEFVTRKITDAVARIYLNGGGQLRLGNLDARRDWGHAKDYCMAMYLMMQHEKSDDYVVSMNETHSIKDFLEEAFTYVGLDWREHVTQDERFMRPNDVQLLLGDSTKAREVLGWKPAYDFRSLVREMVDADLERVKRG